MTQNGILVRECEIEEKLNQQRSSFMLRCTKYLFSFIKSNNGVNETELLIITEELRKQSENIWKQLSSTIINNTDWLVTTKQLQKIYKESEPMQEYKLIPWPILSQFMELEQIMQPIYAPGTTKTNENVIGYKFLRYVPNFTWNRPRSTTTSQIDSHVITLRNTIENTEEQEKRMQEKATE